MPRPTYEMTRYAWSEAHKKSVSLEARHQRGFLKPTRYRVTVVGLDGAGSWYFESGIDAETKFEAFKASFQAVER